MPGSLWTEDATKELVRLFYLKVDGSFLSHRCIGAKLGISRNAIIGKLHRLKLTRDPLANIQGADYRVVPQQKKPVKQPAIFVPGEGFRRKKAKSVSSTPQTYGRRGPSRPPAPLPVSSDASAGPSPHAATLLELNDAICRFPIGDVGHPGFHFCGGPVGKKEPYCEYHGKLCYAPIPKRRKPSAPNWSVPGNKY